MKNVIFNFEKIETMDDFYQTAVKELTLPDYFGNNLDALWDVFTGEIELPIKIEFENLTLEKLDEFESLIDLFQDACVELGYDNFQFEYYLKDEEL
jgi:ribonuclease inhibitor